MGYRCMLIPYAIPKPLYSPFGKIEGIIVLFQYKKANAKRKIDGPVQISIQQWFPAEITVLHLGHQFFYFIIPGGLIENLVQGQVFDGFEIGPLDRFIEQFVQPFAFIFTFCAFFFELFQLNKIRCTVTAKFLFSSC